MGRKAFGRAQARRHRRLALRGFDFRSGGHASASGSGLSQGVGAGGGSCGRGGGRAPPLRGTRPGPESAAAARTPRARARRRGARARGGAGGARRGRAKIGREISRRALSCASRRGRGAVLGAAGGGGLAPSLGCLEARGAGLWGGGGGRGSHESRPPAARPIESGALPPRALETGPHAMLQCPPAWLPSEGCNPTPPPAHLLLLRVRHAHHRLDRAKPLGARFELRGVHQLRLLSQHRGLQGEGGAARARRSEDAALGRARRAQRGSSFLRQALQSAAQGSPWRAAPPARCGGPTFSSSLVVMPKRCRRLSFFSSSSSDDVWGAEQGMGTHAVWAQGS
jgi:hypothetical protein